MQGAPVRAGELDQAAQVTLTGRAGRVVYRSPDEGFRVMMLDTDQGPIRVTGALPEFPRGQTITVTGAWRTHATHGRQLVAEAAQETDPVTEKGIIGYLVRIPGIGPGRARALYQAHGQGVFDALDRDPGGVLSAVPRMPARDRAKAAIAWRGAREDRDLHVLLAGHGLARHATKINEMLGEAALAVIRTDPFVLCDLPGVGFLTADRIAKDLKVNVPLGRRTAACLTHVLGEAERHGDTFLPHTELERRVRDLVGEAANVVAAVDEAHLSRVVVREQDRVYLARLWRWEETLARLVASREGHAGPPVEGSVLGAGARGLTTQQTQGVLDGLRHRLSVITGGPGTGKTTLTRAIVDACGGLRLRLALCAPTGRAARRLTELTGHPAHTIHRLCAWNPGGRPARDQHDPVKADVVVCDEASMLTLEHAVVLLGALPPGCRLVLVGDVDQLPPVGPGRPFADLIDSGRVPVTRLGQVFRQSARSMIIQAAQAINQGRAPAFTPGEGEDRDLFFLHHPRGEDIPGVVVDLVARRLPEAYGLDPRQVQVLAPMFKGPAGLDALNHGLREALTDPAGQVGRWRVGERLMVTRNDPDTGLVNGQQLYLRQVTDQALVLAGEDGQVVVLGHDAAVGLRSAYAVSVHRAQGTEAPAVIIVAHRSHAHMLTRPLVYTAITRSRKLCIIVGDQVSLARAATRSEHASRHSHLVARLRPTGHQVAA